MDQHQLVAALKQLALELGQTPTCEQFKKHVEGGWRYRTLWPGANSWNRFVEAAGLAPTQLRPQRIDSSVFKADINRHLEDFSPREIIKLIPYETMAVISDIHWPFHDQRIVDLFFEYVGDEKPRHVIINGDAGDMYSHARFPRSHNIFTPEDEENRFKEENTKFWKEVKRRHPEAECWQLLGNHDIRPAKQVLTQYPQIEHWAKKYMKDLFNFEGVRTIHDHREELIFGNVAVFHGYRSKLGEHRDFTLMNCINGHTHKGGVVFKQIRGRVLWELNTGMAGNPEAKGLTYTPQKITDWTPGFGGLNKRGPQFIHG